MVHSIKISTLKNKAFYYAAYFYEKFKIARFELPGRQVGIFFSRRKIDFASTLIPTFSEFGV